MLQKGSILISVSILVVIISGIIIIGILQKNLINQNLSTNTKPQTDSQSLLSNWPKMKVFNGYATLIYPDNWFSAEEKFISPLPYNPNINLKVNNLIRLYLYDKQIHLGYLNFDWFKKIKDLKENQSFKNEIHNSDKEVITKLQSGKIKSGEEYVTFTTNLSQNSNLIDNEVKAFILKDDKILEISLINYDDAGLKVYETILENININ